YSVALLILLLLEFLKIYNALAPDLLTCLHSSTSFVSSGRSTNLLLNLFLIRNKSKLLVPVIILTNVWFIKSRHQISFLLSSSYVPVLNSISTLVLSCVLLIISIYLILPIK